MSRQVSGHAQSQRTLSESVRSLSATTASDVETMSGETGAIAGRKPKTICTWRVNRMASCWTSPAISRHEPVHAALFRTVSELSQQSVEIQSIAGLISGRGRANQLLALNAANRKAAGALGGRARFCRGG